MRLDRGWLIVRSGSRIAAARADQCAQDLRRLDCEVSVAVSGLARNPFPELLSAGPLPDLALVLGGDGTVLGAARHLAPFQIPLLSFNVGGHLGFLTHDPDLLILSDESSQLCLWRRLREDRFALERRMMLEAQVARADQTDLGQATRAPARAAAAMPGAASSGVRRDAEPHAALNDFYLRPCLDEISPTCLLELEIDAEVVDQYRGDGLIIATPTGSTGYAMAAGGPILHPGIEAIVINPICPMSLSSRAVVVPPRSRLTIRPLGDSGRRVRLWKDGAHGTLLEPGDHCVIEKARHPALLVQIEHSPSYYRTLSHKLHWAGSLEASDPSGGRPAP